MAFTVQDYHDLARLLWEHPEWRGELRRLLLPDELLALPEIVRQLAEAQQRAEERLSRLEMTVQHLTEHVGVLTEGQQRLIERVDSLTEGQQRLIKGQQRLTERVDVLTEGQQRLTERVDSLTEGQQRLTEGQQRLTDIVGGLKGSMLEITYQKKAFAYFGPLLRQAKVIELHTLVDALEAALTSDEFHDSLLLDLLVTGKLRHAPESPDILLAVEISSVVDRTDVSRAVRRAGLLRKAGYRAVPVVAGEEVTQGGEAVAREQNVVLLQDGRIEFWKEALASWEGIKY